MEFLRFGPDDADGVTAYAEILSAARAVDSPWSPPITPKRAEGRLRHGWDGEVEIPYLGIVDGSAVAVGTLATSEYDNLQLAWLGLWVHPEHRRRGHGSATLEHLLVQSKALGRTMVGADGWDSGSTRGFAARHGFEEKSRAVQRRQLLAEVDWPAIERLHADALDAASSYQVVHREGATPDDELEALAELTASINDAPTDDLEIEDEVFTADRVRAYEDAQLAKGDRLFRIVARDRRTGQMAGHSVVVVNGELPHLADQHDTSVAAAHRGHRLGLLLKTEMNLWLREVQPQLIQISTFNAESNDHMIGVNEAIGYRIVGRELEFQRSV